MIAPRKNAFVEALFGRYIAHRLRHAFHGVHVRGGEHLAALPTDRPVLALANHANWWDLFALQRLTRLAPHKVHYGLMEERNLRPHRFLLQGLGLFSVDLGTPLGAALGLRRALRLLSASEPRPVLWLFPQGRIEGPVPPAAVRPGAAWLARQAPDALVLPVALRYEFFREERPAVLIEVAPPVPASEAATDAALLSLLRAPALALDRRIIDGAGPTRDLAALLRAEGFASLERPFFSENKKWEWICRALTGRLAGFTRDN